MSTEAEASMRSETQSSPWQAIPARTGARRRRMLNLGQFIRSLVLVALFVAAATMIGLQPAHDGAGVNAPHETDSAGPLIGRSILHFPR
jgi:hypothetical protein